ncbi:MAG TPA: CYTH domain-containing protein [Solirubrobacterales bacterium]|nr:CYTH domain-containing protein [Solirubrobacterales bacterium]
MTESRDGGGPASGEKLEVERKFLLDQRPRWLGDHPSVHIRQGYVAIVLGEVEVRVRETDDGAVLTVKRGEGEVRREEEIELADDQFRALWPLTEGARLEKRRYSVPHEGGTVEVDVYEGPLDGLAVAEVEFDSDRDSAEFEPPEWFGRELTGNTRYANESLATDGAPKVDR